MNTNGAIALICLALAATPAAARMYEWVNPSSGRVQMSGEPPSWYRADAPGPRVRVFENGSLVDDTAIALTAAENAALRDYALERAAQRRELAALRELELAASREAAQSEAAAEQARIEAEREQRRAAGPEEEPAGGDRPADDPGLSPEEALAAQALDEATIERLKSIISEFDRLATGR